MTKREVLNLLEALPEDWQGFVVPLSDGSLGKGYMKRVKATAFAAHVKCVETKAERAELVGVSLRAVQDWSSRPFYL